jgi:hypothetical protein
MKVTCSGISLAQDAWTFLCVCVCVGARTCMHAPSVKTVFTGPSMHSILRLLFTCIIYYIIITRWQKNIDDDVDNNNNHNNKGKAIPVTGRGDP